ncbi:hypothetical protein [Bacillus sp. SA1-12]|uniref:hypothetical protein n=1 Tax=Bacillus sp. SA1-12 TaxID=1455638 RepID=UPI000ADB02A6|nr:hypothetical protein [Bacillus sp. SA1-12]
MRKRDNRKAILHEVVEGTGVAEELVLKFIRTGKIHLANIPHLGYPCEKCGKTIKEERMCEGCKKDLTKQLQQMEQEEKISEHNKPKSPTYTYYSQRTKN